MKQNIHLLKKMHKLQLNIIQLVDGNSSLFQCQALSLNDCAVQINKYFGHNSPLHKIVTIPHIAGKCLKALFHLFGIGVTEVYSVIKAVLMGIEALGKVGVSGRTIVEKIGTYLKDVSAEAIFIVVVGYFVCFILINNENIVIVNVVQLTADKEAFAARQTEKDLTAIVDMYVRIGISVLGIVDSEACVVAGMGNCQRTAFKYTFHYVSHFLLRIANCDLWVRRLLTKASLREGGGPRSGGRSLRGR